jgi:hypothetical protein
LSTIKYQKSNFKFFNEFKGLKVFLHYFGISIQLKGHFSVDKCTIDPKNCQISLLELTKLQPKIKYFFFDFFEFFGGHFLKNSKNKIFRKIRKKPGLDITLGPSIRKLPNSLRSNESIEKLNNEYQLRNRVPPDDH